MAIRLDLSAQLPDDYRDLFWHEFLASRGRGISLAAHFPWLLDPPAGTTFVALRDGDRLLGGLTLRPCSQALMALGLVCMEASCRGKGLGKALLQAALAEVDQRGHEATVLWTRQPAIYRGLGFEVRDSSCRLAIEGWHRDASLPVQVGAWPDTDEVATPARGLPPYALEAQRIRHPEGAAVIALRDPLGLQVVEQSGDPELALAALRAWAPESWRVHSTSRDAPWVRTLVEAIRMSPGLSVSVAEDALQMWRPHPQRPGGQQAPASWPLLDRF